MSLHYVKRLRSKRSRSSGWDRRVGDGDDELSE
jgi:hypothetical protein